MRSELTLAFVAALSGVRCAAAVDPTTCDGCRSYYVMTVGMSYGENVHELFASDLYAGLARVRSTETPYLSWWSVGGSGSSSDDVMSDAVSLWELPSETGETLLTGRFLLPAYICGEALLYRGGRFERDAIDVVTSSCPPYPPDLPAIGYEEAARRLRDKSVITDILPLMLDQISNVRIMQWIDYNDYYGQ
jgi:hypothetical protein